VSIITTCICVYHVTSQLSSTLVLQFSGRCN